MSSLLSYGQGFLVEDIWSGAGLSEPWAQSFGWGGGDNSSKQEDADSIASQAKNDDGGGGSSQFFSVIQAAAPPEASNSPKVLTRYSTKKELHWDSPPNSPSTVFVHLPYAVLSIISTGTKADAVVVGVFQHGSESILDTLLYLPKGLNFAEYVIFKPDLLSCINGKIFSTDKLNLPAEFSNALRQKPQAFLGQRFSLEKYNGIIFGLWCDGSKVPATAEAAFSDVVQSLPMLLSNRIKVKQQEQLGRRFDAILRVVPDAVLFVDDECAQVVLNPAAASLLGLPCHGEVDPSIVAVAMRTLTDRCSSRTDPQHWLRLLSTDEELEIEEDWELTTPRRVLHVRSYPVTSHAAHGRLWIYEDVTAERDAEEAIEAANRAKSQFLAMMSHELRTPMTGVLGMLDLLHLTNLEEEQQGLVKIMQESADGLMEVINNILDFCKIEAGRLQLEEIDFSLSDMFEQIQGMLKPSSLRKELKLTISSDPSGRHVVRGDPVRLRQVLLNVISNAIRFTEVGSIDVSWRFLDPQWVDTTVVATSQSSSGKSKLINQIINASRGEKCSVEHFTTPAGRSVIVVNCSSAGAAGPYLETLVSTSPRPPVPSQFSVQTQPAASDSRAGSAQQVRSQSTGLPSFPVFYSLPPVTLSLPEALQNAETRHHFTDRKSIAAKELLTNPNFQETALQAGRNIADKGEVPAFTKKHLFKDPTLDSEGIEFRARKYQRLAVENSSKMLGISSPVEKDLHHQLSDEILGLNRNPQWRIALDAISPTSVKSSPGRIPLRALDSFVVKSKEGITQKQRLSAKRPHECLGPMSSNQTEVQSEKATSIPDAEKEGPASGPKFCEVCKSELENREYELTKEMKPEDKVWLEVTISDTGVGIGKEQLDRLFVGSQAGSQRRNAAGTGLGLAICKGLLCLMNGKIQIDSKIGEGTTVILTVPLLPAEEAVHELIKSVSVIESATAVVQPTAIPEPPCSKPVVVETDSSESKSEQISVLVAEDNRVNQLLIRKMFQHFGHKVEIVGNGKLAVEAVQRTVYDLVLMDVQMPILDGLSATKAIRGLSPPISQIPIYALSADTPGSGPMEETGLDGYIKKPIAWETMSQLVTKILAAKSKL